MSSSFAAAGSLALGVVLVLLAELGSWPQARIFGAAVISGGAAVLGVSLGLAGPRSAILPRGLRSHLETLALMLALVLAVPLIFTLVAALVGLLPVVTRGSEPWTTVLLGLAVALLMLASTLASLVGAVRALRVLR